MPLHKNRYHPRHLDDASRKISTRRSSSFFDLDRQAMLAAQLATRKKYQHAGVLLAGQGVSPGYTIPPSLQQIYDRASDYATNMTLLPKSTPGKPFYSSVRIVPAGSLGNATNTIVSLQDETDTVDDLEYYGPLSFGSQSQTLQIDFDTGSADMWVPVNCSNCGTLSSFQASASASYRNTNQPFEVTYGLGAVSGTLAVDTVAVGSFKVYNQSIGAVQSVSENFANSPNDGLAGLAFGTIANSHKPTLFENLIPQLQAPLFSVYMSRKQVHGSEICFGGVDASKASDSAIYWVPVVSKTWWTVSMPSVLVDNMLVQTGNLNAIIDTGTSFIYVPTHVVTAIYKLIPDSAPAPDYDNGFYAYPCDTQITVSFVLGQVPLALDPRDLNLGQYESDPSGRSVVIALYNSLRASTENIFPRMCIGAIADAGPTLPFAILGDSFLKSFVSVYDYSHGARVGFMKSINE